MERQHPLRTYRKNAKISLDALAERTGASKATLSRVETGEQVPSLGLVMRLMAATDGAVTANDFLPSRPAPAPQDAAA